MRKKPPANSETARRSVEAAGRDGRVRRDAVRVELQRRAQQEQETQVARPAARPRSPAAGSARGPRGIAARPRAPVTADPGTKSAAITRNAHPPALSSGTSHGVAAGQAQRATSTARPA